MKTSNKNYEKTKENFKILDNIFFSANKSTNIIYKITDSKGASMLQNDINQINGIVTGHKYILRIQEIIKKGYKIDFDSFEDDTFKLNLKLIDSDLPEILAHIVLNKYKNRIVKITDVINELGKSNPMKYDLSQGHKFYEYRIVNFLVEAALGMTSKKVWSGKFDVIGGIVIVKPNSEILCYHLIDFNKFKEYLKTSSQLDNPSGSRMGYGSIYQMNRATYIKLNFQVKA